jgi:hypothetical protein
MNRMTETGCLAGAKRSIPYSGFILRKNHTNSQRKAVAVRANLKPRENRGAIRPAQAFSLGDGFVQDGFSATWLRFE